MHDLIIIGAGPAGITAAIYAARKRLDFLVITRDIGGQTILSGEVENYTGYQYITGLELVKKFEEHMKQFQISLKEGEEVRAIEKAGNGFLVKTDRGAYESKTVIIASGRKPKLLNVPGEAEFKNRGLSYCATCDAPLFAGMDVAVIGGGNAALDATLQLMKIARKTYLVNRSQKPSGDAVMREKVEGSGKVTILNKTRIVEILGDKMVSGMMVEREGKRETISVQGVFVEAGSVPNCDFAPVEKNALSEIKINEENMTNVNGIFAAGDVTNVLEKQIIIAAGEGAKATLAVSKYLSKMNVGK